MKKSLERPSSLPTGWIRTGSEGLTEAEAENRKKNLLPPDEGKPVYRIITDNIFTLFNGLNLLLALALLLVGSYRNMLFVAVVALNTGIAIVQEIRARNTIRRLKLLRAARVRVIREGQEIQLLPEQVAEGDLMVLRAGDQVTADAVVISGNGRADESLLTGESDDIPKAAGAWMYSGSYLTEGRCVCQAVYVGEDSYLGKLTREAKTHRKTVSGLEKEMNRLIQWDSLAVLPLGLLLFLKATRILGLTVSRAVPPTVAAVLGMIPEGLILLTSIALTVGLLRLAKKNVLVQSLNGIEGLARVDVLCLDKTGTLTSGHMKLETLIPQDCEEEEAREALRRFLGAFDDRGGTLEALREAVGSGSEIPVAIQPFSSARKKSAATFEDGVTYILGAPEYALAGKVPEALREQTEALTKEGRRLLVLAEARGVIQGDVLPEVTRILALLSLKDEIRPRARETVNYFAQEGVTMKVISGDDPLTVSRIAGEAGIGQAEEYVDARTLSTEEAIREACEKYTVFGRVTPEQKKRLIIALKEKGHTVAMTGDGVNDIPALRAADCSIAMAEGADAVRSTAMITLLRSDFEAVPEILLEGRRVINNISRSATLFLTKTIFSLLLTLLALFLPGPYPFMPIQMSLVSTCTVGIPGFLLALEKTRDRIQGDFLKRVTLRALPGGVAVALCGAVATVLPLFGWDQTVCATLATWTAALIGVTVLVRVAWPFNLPRLGVVAGAAALFVLSATLFEPVFYLTNLKGMEWLALALLMVFGIGVYIGVYLLERKISGDLTAKKKGPAGNRPEAAAARKADG